MFETILVAVDGSANGKRALDAAVELAKCHHSLLLLLHVIADLPLPEEIVEMIRSGEVTESRSEILRTSAEIILQNARRRCEQAGYANVRTDYIAGDPARKIIEYADTHDAEVIVIGHRGLDSRGDLLGSVARKLVNLTRRSCLIVG
jgi:nucleotide-binding universal stress UspA family protein